MNKLSSAAILLAILICPSQKNEKPETMTIRVLLIDYKTGRPVKNSFVGLLFRDANGRRLHTQPNQSSKSNKNGVVLFKLDAPPPRIEVIPINEYECSDIDFKTSDVIASGVTGAWSDSDLCKHHSSSLPAPHPGEIVFPVHRRNLWQRFWQPFE